MDFLAFLSLTAPPDMNICQNYTIILLTKLCALYTLHMLVKHACQNAFSHLYTPTFTPEKLNLHTPNFV